MRGLVGRRLPLILLVAIAAFGVGCQHTVVPVREASLGTLREDATHHGKPLTLLVVDPSRGDDDARALAVFSGAAASLRNESWPAVLDLSESSHRADAAPLHALERPTLVCFSPGGLIVSRDDGPITAELVRQRAAEATREGLALDATYRQLSAAVDAGPDDIARRMALADFLLADHGDQQAIPHLERVAHDESADVAVRVRAWVALGRAHLWVIEPEKARHAAQSLMATLGPRSAEAVAGGNLVRGLQDTKAKRYGRAAGELRAAAAAAPDSSYGKEAAGLLAQLPRGSQ